MLLKTVGRRTWHAMMDSHVRMQVVGFAKSRKDPVMVCTMSLRTSRQDLGPRHGVHGL